MQKFQRPFEECYIGRGGVMILILAQIYLSSKFNMQNIIAKGTLYQKFKEIGLFQKTMIF